MMSGTLANVQWGRHVSLLPLTVHSGRPQTGHNRMFDTLAAALNRDRTIDIVTLGRRSGRWRTTEIWFTNIGGRIIICGTPSAGGPRGQHKPRDWLANLRAHSEFEFHFKESLQQCLKARAEVVTDPEDRRTLMSAPQTAWYRDQGYSVDDLVQHAPVVEVFFLPPYAGLNRPD